MAATWTKQITLNQARHLNRHLSCHHHISSNFVDPSHPEISKQPRVIQMITIAGGILLAVLFLALLPYLVSAVGWLRDSTADWHEPPHTGAQAFLAGIDVLQDFGGVESQS